MLLLLQKSKRTSIRSWHERRRESDVVIRADAAVEYSWHRIGEAGHHCDENGISSPEDIQDSARCDLPSGYRKEVAEPIASKRPSCPCASFFWNWIEVWQQMWLVSSMFSVLRSYSPALAQTYSEAKLLLCFGRVHELGEVSLSLGFLR